MTERGRYLSKITRRLSDFTRTYCENACLVHISDPFRQIAMAIRSQTIKNLPLNSHFLATARKPDRLLGNIVTDRGDKL